MFTATFAIAEPAESELAEPNFNKVDWVALKGGALSHGEKSSKQPINIEDFEISRTEVTVGQYRECVEAQKCTEPLAGDRCNYGYHSRNNYPMNCVTWEQASQFAAFVGGRLPTEQEWEFAAQSEGKDKLYPWGKAQASCQLAWFSGCDSYGTTIVCNRPAGNTEQGLCDMAGNVYEWTSDRYTNDDAEKAEYHVIRGGGFNAIGLQLMTTHRNGAMGQQPYIGFRVARSKQDAQNTENSVKTPQ